MKSSFKKIVMLVLGVIPLLTHKITSLVILSAFVLVWFLSPYFKNRHFLPLPLWIKYLSVGLIFGAFTEYFVFGDHLSIFSNNVSSDIFLSLGIYGCMSLAWYLLLKKFEFSLWGVFLTAGLWGIIFEQNFKILLSFNLFEYLYIFLVYGSFSAIPFLIFQTDFEVFPRSSAKKKYPIALLVQCLAYVGGFLWMAIARSLFKI